MWAALPDLAGFQIKQTLPKISRWFSWNQSAEEQLPLYHIMKLVLAFEFDGDGAMMDHDGGKAEAELAAACAEASKTRR